MIKPPAMGVFARDPPPPQGRGGASSSASQLQSHPSNNPAVSPRHPPSCTTSQSEPLAADEFAPDPANQDDETLQDDDDQRTVDEEAGIIRCICGCDDDDGFTIQCDRCLVWQHCACFGMSQASVPDEYLCEQCEPRPVDVAFAQAHQQKRKNNEARKALMDRNLKRQAQALASNGYNQPFQDPVSSPTSSIHPSSTTLAVDHQLSAAVPANTNLAPSSSSAAAARSRKPSQALDLSNTQFVVPEVPASAGAGAAQRGGKQRKGHKGSRRGYETPSSVSTPVRGVLTPGSSHERLDDPFDAVEQLEAWHVEFTPINKNIVADPSIVEHLAAAMLDWQDGSPLKGAPGPAGRVIVPTASSHARHAASSKLASAEAYPASSSASSPSSSWPRGPSSPTSPDFSASISAVGDECVPVELTGPSLADLACRTYVKHISESVSAGVFSNLLYANSSTDEPQRGWCASRAFSRPVMHGLFADGSIPAGAFISELRGELYSASTYRNDPINQYAALGATKPHVHLLPPPLNLAIDARRYGTEARFARFSCHPNAVLRPILFRASGQLPARSRTSSRAQSPATAAAAVASSALSMRQLRYADTPPAEPRSEEPQLLFGLFALTDIPRTHEITLGWEWDDAHIVHFLPELVQNPYLESRQGHVDADKHTANMVALAEKGEFPYADTEFSVKMSTVAAALLGCVLCACIGSAAPPGGGGGASANNGRKQDCAVAQMLRVGNGMSLLNVTMPGKTNRKAKLPDFLPLVGIPRHWRSISLPPTPETSVKEEAPPVDASLLQPLAAEGEAETMQLLDSMDVDGEAGCGGNEAIARSGKSRRGANGKGDRMDVDGEERSGSDSAATESDDGGDTRSIASSLTDPLSGLSENETLSEDEDEDLMNALHAADGIRPRRPSTKGGEASAVDAELSGLFLLPPKKRSMRTRIKASMASDGEDQGDDADADNDDEQDQVRTVKSRKPTDASSKVKAGAKRKGKAEAGRAVPDFSSDEDKGYDDYSIETPVKKRRKSGNIADPSSPLSSVPSPDSADSSLSPPPPVPRLSAKRRLENQKRTSDVELSKQKRAAKRARDRNARTPESRSKESASKRRKREEARVHRNAILDLGDTESSEEELSEDDQDADDTAEHIASGASTPRAAAKKAPVLDSMEASPIAINKEPATTDVGADKKAKKEMRATPSAADDRTSAAKKDTPTKTKKVRRILSDSEPSGDEEGALTSTAAARPVASSPKVTKKEDAPQPGEDDSKPTPAAQGVQDTAPTKTAQEGDDKTDATAAAEAPAPAPPTAPAPVPEVKKEEPRVKLSLAEYKRRLAERRVSEQQGGNTSSATPAPLTPSLATPTSEVAPSPSPAVEKTDPLPSSLTRPSEPRLASTPSEAASTPAGPAAESTEAGKATSAAPRGMLFTSISAPTAIRSVEIPKSPSPEPVSSATSAQQQGAATSSAQSSGEAVTAASAPAKSASSEAGAADASSPASAVSNLPGPAGAGGDTPALLQRLETRRARAPSLVGGEKDGQQASVAADGFAKPQSTSAGPASAPAASAWGARSPSSAQSISTPLRSPSLGPTRVQAGRMPPSPSSTSSSSAFNPPKAPRAFMSPPSNTLPTPTVASAAASTAAVPSSAIAAAVPAAASAAPAAAITSTPARIGIAGVANTPSTASSASSASSSNARYPPPGAGLTSPTPGTSALPHYPPRNFAGVPKGPASMRDSDPRADAWAEAREAREAREVRDLRGEYPPPRHLERDMGWGERSRDANSSAAAGGLAGRLDSHSHYAGYRRPSATEYDDQPSAISPYDRPSDPYNRGIVVRGRANASTAGIGGGDGGVSVGTTPGGAAIRDAREPMLRGPEGSGYRDYDDPPPGAGVRGGFRSSGGWGGGSRGRGGARDGGPGGRGGRGGAFFHGSR
ncbi:hypothetical protein NDA16_000083 [Ustilago loliicola]|nr:hypothetical protein NDA16_000083 [Ustilago loliicola]